MGITTHTIKAIDVFLSMMGIRLDSGRLLFIWLPLIAVSLFITKFVLNQNYLLIYSILCWVFYYIGMTLILGTGIKRWMISKFGEDNAWKLFQIILGIMFFNVGSGMSAAALYDQEAFLISTQMIWILVAPMFLIGFGIKFWATWVIGIDVYYYKDLFHEKSHEEWTESGPYKWIKNPMYGVGYLHSYCLGIMFGSIFGLVYALICNVSIFIFYYLVELPFIKKTYL